MKALIAEDEIVLAKNIKECLKREEFESEYFDVVDTAKDGAEALIKLNNNYDLIILDLKMPEVDGIQVIEALNQMKLPKRERPMVVIITAYPGDYVTAHIEVKMGVQALLQKPDFELPELIGVIRELVKSRRQLLEIEKQEIEKQRTKFYRQLLNFEKQSIKSQCNWTLALSDSGSAFIQADGLLNFVDSCPLQLVRLDTIAAALQAELSANIFTITHDVHRYALPHAQMLGNNIFGQLFVGNIQESLIAASHVVLHHSDLKLTFAGPRSYLRYPIEFLHDGSDYLILKHPLKRSITGIHSRGNTGLSHLLSELQDRREKLRILLIASNTRPCIDSVDEEVEELYQWLTTVLPRNRFIVDHLPTAEASYETVLACLKGCKYHMLHYAGHGHHDENFPARSRLFFWEKKNRQGEVRALSVNTLKNTLLMKAHSLRFIYLSCCSSSASSDESTLLNDDFLGMADGLIMMARIPSVLGFRWSVSDRGAKECALAFYESLFDQGYLDTALFNARCRVKGIEEGQDIGDWLSPILIVQG